MTEYISEIPGVDELVRNQREFTKQKAELERKHFGKFALFSHGKLECIVESREEAYEVGYSKYGEAEFSLHEIGAEPQYCGSARPISLEELEADRRI